MNLATIIGVIRNGATATYPADHLGTNDRAYSRAEGFRDGMLHAANLLAMWEQSYNEQGKAQQSVEHAPRLEGGQS